MSNTKKKLVAKIPKKPGRPKKKHAGGRPTKMTADVVGILRDAFHDDFTIEEACRAAGIHKDTYYEECKRNPKFADDMARAQDYPIALAKNKLLKVIKSSAPDAGSLALKFLERRQRDRYTPKMTLEHEGAVLGYSELETPASKAKTPEEARKLAEGMNND
jgi:hypothetical protein